MPEDMEIEVLNFVIGLISEIEELFAINNAIAGGLVTDSETICNTAARTAKQLETMLIGHRLMLKDAAEGSTFPVAELIDTIYKND